jgi:hypothetical protein
VQTSSFFGAEVANDCAGNEVMDLSIFQTIEQIALPGSSTASGREGQPAQTPFVDHLVTFMDCPSDADAVPTGPQVLLPEPQNGDLDAPPAAEDGRLKTTPSVKTEEEVQAPAGVPDWTILHKEGAEVATGDPSEEAGQPEATQAENKNLPAVREEPKASAKPEDELPESPFFTPAAASGTVPSTTGTVPSTTGTVPSETTGTVPSESTNTVPSEATNTVPSETTGTVPGEATKTVPSETTGTVPQQQQPTGVFPSDPTVKASANEEPHRLAQAELPPRAPLSEPGAAGAKGPDWSFGDHIGASRQTPAVEAFLSFRNGASEAAANSCEKSDPVSLSRISASEAAVDTETAGGGEKSPPEFTQGRTPLFTLPTLEASGSPNDCNIQFPSISALASEATPPAAPPPGQATVPQNLFLTENGQPIERVVAEIVERASLVRNQQAVTLDVQLKPAFLGKVRIEAVLRPDQGLTAVVTVQDPKVKSLLQSELPGLLEPLEKAGIKLEFVCLEQPTDSANRHQQSGYRRRLGQQVHGSRNHGDSVDGLNSLDSPSARIFNDGRIHYFA